MQPSLVSAVIAAVSQAQVTDSTSADNSGVEKNRQCLQIWSLDRFHFFENMKNKKKKKGGLIPKCKSEPSCSLKVWVLIKSPKYLGGKKPTAKPLLLYFNPSFLNKHELYPW